jgi:hypothetical protein
MLVYMNNTIVTNLWLVPVLKVLLTFQIFEYSSLREGLREVPIVCIISPQLVTEFLRCLYVSQMDKNHIYISKSFSIAKIKI